jgi:hypothetical protein
MEILQLPSKNILNVHKRWKKRYVGSCCILEEYKSKLSCCSYRIFHKIIVNEMRVYNLLERGILLQELSSCYIYHCFNKIFLRYLLYI